MRYLMIGVLVLFMAGGCSTLSDEQKNRIEVIVKENEAIAGKMAALVTKAKAGLITPSEVVLAMDELRVTMDKNRAEIKTIQESGGTMAMVWAAVGLFGRTALHAVSIAVPGSGPIASALQAFLTLLLGGSSTKKTEPKA